MIASGHQPNYLPWLGFFDKMLSSDVFIIEDSVQFEQLGFTNRNKIKVGSESRWLTVPIVHVGEPQLINQVKISNNAEPDWAKRHWLTLKHHYYNAPFWKKYSDFFEQTYNRKWELLIDLNMHLIRGIMAFLDIDTPLVMASSFNVAGKKSDLVLAKCKYVGADVQLAGTGAKEYLDYKKFEQEGIKIKFQDFVHPIYKQPCGEFIPNLSVVDYLFCTGGIPWKNVNQLEGSLSKHV
jgi:hypothetical protein